MGGEHTPSVSEPVLARSGVKPSRNRKWTCRLPASGSWRGPQVLTEFVASVFYVAGSVTTLKRTITAGGRLHQTLVAHIVRPGHRRDGTVISGVVAASTPMSGNDLAYSATRFSAEARTRSLMISSAPSGATNSLAVLKSSPDTLNLQPLRVHRSNHSSTLG